MKVIRDIVLGAQSPSDDNRYSAVLVGPCKTDQEVIICMDLLEKAGLKYELQHKTVFYVKVPHEVVVGFTRVKFPNLKPGDRTTLSVEDQCRILIEIVNELKGTT